ncbi:hypothetical protein COCHEDRAFT_1203160 [Bipolaris maydis C5]|uniref:Heme haloperoxidase family profile domain-containing protein n=1 Tax=Cochliobolus heterostrophus (strain C5 / ATCC 48332 / race O) TaxID=701091 RepID=M2UW86_COCH5|nr:hypothetical protein COCHEDRAFT_1203160 [Bipolaris maydis C5]KAJ5021324.1 Chloroperoxidase [Bipolaris maydis]KAJ5061401.1 Chloroperoxidase [Bipolaris maydis]KAJ6198530.1 Chloroperoxidase [Bipolaris maydis]KAJ6210678.1 Chloroperoxidase [Bipolaris maydis]
MRFTSVPVVALAAVGVVSAQGSMDTWTPAGTGDSRGPCPMLNTLANHEFLPHNGRNFTLDILKHALKTALNISDDVTVLLHTAALTTNPGGSTWGLDTLSTHNILEHDGSLSRQDNAINGDSTSFNATIYERTRSFFTAPTISLQMAANARLARMLDSLKINPQFSITLPAVGFSHLETAIYMIVFGDRTQKTAQRDQVDFFFEKERLPTELGWKTPNTVISGADVKEYQNLIVANTKYQADIMGP